MAGWLVRLAETSAAEFDLVCFPWAGGGAAGFQLLKPHLEDDLALWAVTPPGRQHRLAEPPEENLDLWFEAIGREIADQTSRPLILLGHSFGALVAYELAHWLAGDGRRRVKLVCVSSRRAPGLPSRTAHLVHAPDSELVAWMRRLGGVHDEIAASEEMLDLVLPPLREDIALDVAYRPAQRAGLDVPILALAGGEDPIMAVAEMAGWSERTAAGFTCHALPGGHFHLQDHPARVLKLIRSAVRDGVSRAALAVSGPPVCDQGR